MYLMEKWYISFTFLQVFKQQFINKAQQYHTIYLFIRTKRELIRIQYK